MKKVAVVALAGLLAVPLLASARHLDVRDPDDTRGLLDIRRVEVGGTRNTPRWSVSTSSTWSVQDVWDAGFVLVRIDTFGTSRADYYAMIRSNGRALVAHLFRDRQKRRDHRIRRLQVTREDRRNVTVAIDLRQLKRRSSRVYSWFVQTLFSSDNCRSVCIDRAPDRGAVSEPGPSPSPTEPDTDTDTDTLTMAPRLIVLGWDSATFDVADPLIEAGRLPALASLARSGFRAPLRSTWPPMTDCAWTSAFTGQNPGKHGIFGSWYRAPGRYECRYFSSRDRRAPALWELAPEVRFLVWNVPMTFPPSEVNGTMVAGYGAPPGARITRPHGLQDALSARWSLEDLLDRAPHGSLERFLSDLLRGLEAQAEALPWAARETGADAVVAVWPHIDRAQHFFWRFRGTDHPLRDAVDSVYEAMDRATAAVLEAFPDADVLVVSDHGAGTLEGDVNLGAWLASTGRAVYAPVKRSRFADAAWAMPPGLRRLGRRLSPSLARRAMSSKLTGQLAPFDWSRTKAFLGFHSDLWLNLQGREQQGIVAPADADRLLTELAEELLSLEDPRTGRKVFAGAHRRDSVYSGAAAALAPDLILDSWSAGYRVAPSRKASEVFVSAPESLAGMNEAWSSDHRPLGIFVAGGPRIGTGTTDELSLYDVCPTSLALLERSVPRDLDGRVAEVALAAGFLEAHPIAIEGSDSPRPDRLPDDSDVFDEDEAAAVAAHLKDLGYIE